MSHILKRRRMIFSVGSEFPSVALQKVGNAWFVVTDNADEPDGYFVLQDGVLVIDESAVSGLSISLDGPLLVGT